MSLVLRYHIVNIYELQKRTAMSEADLYRNLNSMIQRNMLPGYSINYQAKILERRIPYPTNPIPAPTPTMTKPIDDFKPGYRKCECCGASAYLQSPKQTCQYCGNAIDYKK